MDLIDEMRTRGMSPNPDRKFKQEQWPKDLYQDWVPQAKDLQLIRKRIQGKINQKPHWYRWTKKNPKD